MDGLVPLSVRGDIKKKSRQNYSDGGGGNEPRRDPIKDTEQFEYAPQIEVARPDTPRIPEVPMPEIPADMVLDNPDPIKQNRGEMNNRAVSKSLDKALNDLVAFSKGVRRGKL